MKRLCVRWSFLCLLWTGWAAAEEAAPKSLPPNYRLVYSQDFKSEAALQDFHCTSPQHWKYIADKKQPAIGHTHCGGKYRPPHRSPHNIALIHGQQFESFVLDVQVRQTGKEYGHRDACLFFNYQDKANFYYVHIATRSDNHAHQIFIVDDKPRTKISTKTTKGYDWGKPDQWHHVRLVRDVESGKIEVYVNDMSQPLMTASDKEHGLGYLGFGSFDDEGCVSKIRVYAPEKVEGKAEFFTAKK